MLNKANNRILYNMSIIRRPFRDNSYNNIVFVLIGLNVLVYLAVRLLWGQIPLFPLLAMNPALVLARGWVWQFFTYMFVHDLNNITHLLFNMLALFIFGRQVEQRIGSREFLLFYIVTGMLAGIFSFFAYLFTGNLWISLVGASGAIFAVQLAFAVFFPHAIIYIWGILPLRAPLMVLGFTGLQVVFMITGSGGNVAHVTHLAGFAFGWLYFLARFGVDPWKAMRQ